MDLYLSGKKVLITGASQGIGEGLALAFATEGCRLHLVARSGDKLQQLAERVRTEFGVTAEIQVQDMTEPDAAQRIADAVGDIDILVNNAGAIPGGDLWTVGASEWRAGWEVKVFGFIDLTRLLYARMKERGEGVILNNIGNGGENFDFNYVAGSTGNAALMAFTRAIGGRSLDDGIRVVGINPGPVATDRITKILKTRARERFGDEARYEELLATYPLGRAAAVDEVADLAVFLASPRSSYTSGTVVTVDGGGTSRRSI